MTRLTLPLVVVVIDMIARIALFYEDTFPVDEPL